MTEAAWMVEEKGWISADDMARHTGHKRVLCLIAWLLVGLALLDSYLVPLPGRGTLLVSLFSLTLIGSLTLTRLFLKNFQMKAPLDLALLLGYLVVVCWFTGKADSPFVPVIYLILMATSLTLGRRTTYLMAGLAVACYFLLLSGASPAFPGNIIGHLIRVVPFILMAHVGAMLSGEAEGARADVERLSLTDDLTGLNNMRSFETLALQQEKISRRYGTPFAICMLDADNLKQINDRYGHLAGTELIKWTARIIKANIRESDVAARFGGDEFIVMYNDHDREQIRPAVERIVRAMDSCPFSYEGELIECTLSAGIASYPADGGDLKSVVKQADLAMYRSKRMGKNRVSLAGNGGEGNGLKVGGEELRGGVAQLRGERAGVHLGEGDLPR